MDINSSRSLGGGAFFSGALNARAAVRVSREPAFRVVDYGFRPARTFR